MFISINSDYPMNGTTRVHGLCLVLQHSPIQVRGKKPADMQNIKEEISTHP